MHELGRAWIAGFAAALLLTGASTVALRLVLPSDHGRIDHSGLSASPTNGGVRVSVDDPLPGGLRDGDVIVSVEGILLAEARTDPISATVRVTASDRSLRYGVVRDGRAIELEIVRDAYPLAALVKREWSSLLFMAAMLAIGVYVFARRPDDPAARAMLTLSAAGAASTPYLLGLEAPDMLGGPILLATAAGAIEYLVFWVAFLWFAVAFARPLRGKARLTRLIRWLMILAAALPIGYVAVASGPAGVPTLRWVAALGPLSDLFSLPILVLLPAVLAVGYLDDPDALHRQRIRWVALATGSAALIGLVVMYIPGLLGREPLIPWSASGLLGLPIPIAIGLAIVRHGAFDLRVAVNRSLVYGSLTLLIVSVYVTALSVLSSLLLDQAGFVASLLATGVVAVLVQPARDSLQRVVNRLMYGDRDEPYAAITRLGERLESTLTPEGLLPAVAEAIGRAVRIPHARVELPRGGGFVVAGSYGAPTGDEIELALAHQGGPVGRLVLARRGPGEHFSAADRRLLDDLAWQAATAAHAVLLMEDLQRARSRLVTAREEERRLLRKRLHDEIGPALAGIGLNVEASRATLATNPELAVTALAELERDARSLVEDVRAIVERLRAPTRQASTVADDATDGAAARERDRDVVGSGLLRAGGAALEAPFLDRPDTRLTRPSRAVRLTWMAGLILILVAGLQAAYRFAQPGDGSTLTPDVSGWGSVLQFVIAEPRDPGAAAGLRPGDRLVAIDGRPIDEVIDAVLDDRSARPTEWMAGGTVTETVVRDGLLTDVSVGLRVSSLGEILRALATGALQNAGFVMLVAVAVFVMLRRPGDIAARLLWLLGAAISANLLVETVGGPAPTTADLFDPPAYWSFQILGNLIWPVVVGPVVSHLGLAFPAPSLALRRRPGLTLGILYGVAPALIVVLLATSDDASAAWRSISLWGAAWMLVILAVGIGRLVTLAVRERDPEARAKVRWVALGFAVAFGSAVPLGVAWFAGVLSPELGLTLPKVFVVAIPATLAIAIVQHRLFDIDLVWNRTLVYAALTLIVVGVYVASVTLLGRLLAQTFAVSLLATGVVAVLVHPIRERIQRAVNRLMYGERDEPYIVVSRLAARLEAGLRPDAILPVVAETVAQALRLPYVGIELQLPDGQRQLVAAVGELVTEPFRLPLVFQGTLIGQLVLARRPGDADFGARDRGLLTELARQTSRVAHVIRLREALDHSRRQLIEAREEERRRIRRDLHDDLGPSLAGIAVRLEAARLHGRSEPARVSGLLDEVQREVQASVSEIRRIVYDLRPPALDELGLVGAIRRQTARLEVSRDPGAEAGVAPPVFTVEAGADLPRLSAAVEVAAYRIVVEAVTNVVRHAAARRCTVSLDVVSGDRLRIEIVDDGRGLSTAYRAGIGLDSIRERAAEIGGEARVEPGRKGGTVVVAELPLTTSEPLEDAA